MILQWWFKYLFIKKTLYKKLISIYVYDTLRVV
jgi:hypothetical protein